MLILGVVFMISCTNGATEFSGNRVPESVPDCIREKIKELQNDPLRNPPAAVLQYQYKGKLVYYVPPAAGDQMSELYGEDCELICRPDGGITGRGDGRCPDFFEERSNEKIVWKDSRE